MNGAPLDGLRVLEFGQIAAGPFAGSLLADLGADVVKIERRGEGDGMRLWPPLMGEQDDDRYSGNFASVNRNKRSIALDLKDAADRDTVLDLVRHSDVVVENYRAGVLDRLGLGYDALAEVNPAVVYCSISGYGQTGPYARHGAFDVTVQAVSGLMSVTGEADGEPVKCGVPVGDFVAGLYAAYTITAAVRRASQTGVGAHIDCSMLGTLLGISALQTSEYFGTGRDPGRLGSAHPRNAPYRAFRAADKSFVVAAGNSDLWRRFCDVVGMAELVDDPRYLTQELRARNQDALTADVDGRLRSRDAADWLAAFEDAGVPCAPINTFSEILADPHVEAMNLVRPLPLPNGVATSGVAFPVAVSGHTAEMGAPPRLDEHHDEVLKEWIHEHPRA
ncbi:MULTISPECIES: CaiB/BaiF CoA transferase family protein [Pseudonocardia]|uniref:Formyl-coenzyme A transferase n=2 Tax=Pseudonocardia TaxID=1847 RepID=A0A1Y2MK20_PSEAH|nr:MULTISPECIES: CoA transferase [Pseudonocardia]OSY35605.1 Formyl-coenzyme A transferase [Pseudonocardia autotrophica]TDN76896.1 crotonobetainyl-CoA:carnitine CoA-transferase CaiB-like acyl-CoA transferase [Pseudonocardia autotrophica]BBG00899.1 CoA transferase [Pseudonocardia autotrophica]GEC27542.1 CoA transferase [Pseudonocardia saturnea]